MPVSTTSYPGTSSQSAKKKNKTKTVSAMKPGGRRKGKRKRK